MDNSRNTTPKKKSPLNVFMIILFAAVLCLCIVVVCVYMSGIRYICLSTVDGGTVKYFGKVSSDGSLSRGKLYYSDGITADVNGEDGLIIYSNGDLYTGDIENLGKSGVGTLTFANGDVYVGEFKNNTLEGTGKITFANGDIYEG